MLPPESTYQFTPDLRICRLLNGLWQVSGGHGRIDPATAIDEMIGYHDAGFTTWDLADHYGPAEDFIGEFRRRLAARSGPEALNAMQAFTKWVPSPGPMTRQVVERAVDVSRRRMDTETLDLMQFHWWDYRDLRYLDALEQLAALRAVGQDPPPGLDQLRHRTAGDHGATGPPDRLEPGAVLAGRSPAGGGHGAVLPGPRHRPVHLRHVAGGIAVGAVPWPAGSWTRELNTASLRKYKQMIDAWGGWALFQELLRAANQVAERHGVSIANVAVARCSTAGRGRCHRRRAAGRGRASVRERVVFFSFQLDAEDWAQLDAVQAKSRDLFKLIGDCGDEYRR